MKPLTPTAIKAANRCPLSYHLTYTDRAPKGRPSANQWRGIAVHRAMRALAQQRMDGGRIDVDAAVGRDRSRIRPLIAAALERGILRAAPVSLETLLTGVIAGTKVEARADRIDANVVWEYKTGGSLDAADRVQAGILSALSGLPVRLVVLDPWTVETVVAGPATEAAVVEAARVRSKNDRTPHAGAHCAKCPVRGACPQA